MEYQEKGRKFLIALAVFLEEKTVTSKKAASNSENTKFIIAMNAQKCLALTFNV
jgi:hypothetical protein